MGVGGTAPDNKMPVAGLEGLTAGADEATQVAIWTRQILLGLEWRYRTSGHQDVRWYRYRQYYRGDWETDLASDAFVEGLLDNITEYTPANRVFSFIRSLLPAIYFRNPGMYVTDDTVDKDIVQRVINYLIKELKIKRELKKVILDCLIIGIGAVQLGFERDVFDGNLANNPDDERINYSDRIKRGLPWVKRIDPMLLVYPWGTIEAEDARWVATETWRQIEDVKDDKNLVNTRQLKATRTERVHPRTSRNTVLADKERNSWIRLWEIRDKKTNELLIISHGKRFHFKDKDPLMIENPPIRTLVFDWDPETNWGVAPVRIMEPQQLELNDQKTHASRMRRTILKKLLVDPDAVLNDSTLTELNDASDVNTAIQVKDPQKNVMELSTTMSPDLSNEQVNTDNDIRFAVGFSRNQAGDVSTGRRTLGEIAIADRNAQLRNDERRDSSADFFEDVMVNLLQIGKAFMSTEMVQLISGRAWTTMEPTLSAYDLALDVVPEEAIQESHITKRETAQKFYELTAGDPVINPVTRATALVEEHNEDPQEWINPEIAQVVGAYLEQKKALAEEGAEEGEDNA